MTYVVKVIYTVEVEGDIDTIIDKAFEKLLQKIHEGVSIEDFEYRIKKKKGDTSEMEKIPKRNI